MKRRYDGLWGIAYLVYLVGFGLNLTATWFFVKTLWLRLRGKRGPTHQDFVEELMKFLGPEILEISPAPTEEGCMVLTNHVNWSDFVIDICLVPKGVYVSRNILKYLFFPGSIFRDWLYGDVVFFKRGWQASKARLYRDVAEKVAEGRSVIVYPEGTRNPRAEQLPLKLGLVKLAYERKLPVYVSMTSGKADICDEHRKVVTLGAPIRNRKSRLLAPTDFDTFQAFVAGVQLEWDKLWQELITTPE